MSEKKVKNAQLVELDGLLRQYGFVNDDKLGWCLARNTTIIKPIIKDFNKILEPTGAVQKYEMEALLPLAKEFGIPHPKASGVFQIPDEKKDEYEAAVEEVNAKEEWAEAVAELEEIKERREKLLEAEVEVKFYKMHIKHLPKGKDNPLTKDAMALLDELGILYGDFEEEQG